MEDLAKACRNLVKKNLYSLGKAKKEEDLMYEFFALKLSQANEIFLSFRDLWRGFKEIEIQAALKGVPVERRKALRKIDDFIKRNIKALKNAQKRGFQQRKRIYKKNQKELEELKRKTISYFRNQNKVAYDMCSYETMRRREKIPAAGDFFDIDNFMSIWLHFRLKMNDPDYVDFPLRFAVHLPSVWYRKLQKLWKKGCSKEEVIRLLMELLSSPEFLDDLIGRCENIYKKFSQKRIKCPPRCSILREIKRCYEMECYASVSLVAVTQIEGVLWDFGKYLNRKNVRIFKTESGAKKQKYLPYYWDFEKKRYKNFNYTGRPQFSRKKGSNLISARQLLERTRLGEFVHKEMYNYLIDEFYDERNNLAHGDLYIRKESAFSALFCLRSILIGIEKRLK